MAYREAALGRAIVVDFDSDVPLYRQIADGVRALIARGALEEGHELPSVRKLGGMLGVNLNTVAKAYRLLADEGVVEIDHGRVGHVIAPRAERRPIDDALKAELSALIGRMRLRGATEVEVNKAFAHAIERVFGKGAGT
jgi:GntR family transcriptional regulator